VTEPVEPADPDPADGGRRRRIILTTLGVVGVLALNVAAYVALTQPAAQEAIEGLARFIYPGAFLLAFLANVTVLIPIPYNGVLLAVLGDAPLPWLAAMLAALGSVLGELTGYAAGRAGRVATATTRPVMWASERMGTSRRAFAFLFVVAAVPNPVFDMAGLAAGTLRIPVRIFLSAVFLGRWLRFLVFAYSGLAIG
jgi:membrane protein YqaA with SNARE-associated domain